MKTNAMAVDAALDLGSNDASAALVASTRSRLAMLGGRILRSFAGASAAQELASLDDRLLRDIGMTDAEIGRTRASAMPLPLIWS